VAPNGSENESCLLLGQKPITKVTNAEEMHVASTPSKGMLLSERTHRLTTTTYAIVMKWLARQGVRGGQSSGFLQDEAHAAAIRFPRKVRAAIGRGTSGVNSSRLCDRYADFRFIRASN
jgi:hypothetical protein